MILRLSLILIAAPLVSCTSGSDGMTGGSTVYTAGEGGDTNVPGASPRPKYLAVTTGGDGVAAGCIPSDGPGAQTKIYLRARGAGTATFSFSGMCVHGLAESGDNGAHLIADFSDEDCESGDARSGERQILSPGALLRGGSLTHQMTAACVGVTVTIDASDASGPASAAFAYPGLAAGG